MSRNTFIVGPHCTGKTSLVLPLERILSDTTPRPVIIHEALREIMSTKQFSADDLESERWIELQQCTLTAQIDAEESLRNQWYILDRLVLDPVVYAQLHLHSVGKLKEMEGWAAPVQRMREWLIIICKADQRAWLSSDARRIAFADAQQWEAMTKQFDLLLYEEGIPFHLLLKDVVSMEKKVGLW